MLPGLIVDGRNRDRDGYRRAILAHANRFEAINPFAAVEAFEDFGLFFQAVGGEKNGNGLSRSSLRRCIRTCDGRIGSSFERCP